MAALRRVAAGAFSSVRICRKVLIARSVEVEFVEEAVGPLLAEVEEGAGEVREGAGPEVDGGPVDAGLFGGGGDGSARDKAFEDSHLSRRQGVELC